MRGLLLLLVLAVPSGAQKPAAERRVPTKLVSLDARRRPRSFREEFSRPAPGGLFEAYGHEIEVEERRYRIGAKRTYHRGFPLVIPLKVGKQKRAVLVRTRGPDLVWQPHWGLALELGRERFTILDLDADGEIGSEGDRVLRPDGDVVSPWNGQLWSRSRGWALRRDKDRWFSTRVPQVPGQEPKLQEAWAYLQWGRSMAGLAPVSWDAERADACRKHGNYFRLTKRMGHDEDPALPGYTPEGRRAARSSVLGYDKEDALEGIIEHFRTAYHLESVLNPRLRRSAMALGGGCFLCWTISGPDTPTGADVVFVWPTPGSEGNYRRFNPSGENPMPLPGRKAEYDAPIGQVIMARVEHRGPYALKVTAKGKPIAGMLSHPATPNAPQPRNDGLVMLAPDRALPAKTWIEAELSLGEAPNRRVHRWRFKTR